MSGCISSSTGLLEQNASKELRMSSAHAMIFLSQQVPTAIFFLHYAPSIFLLWQFGAERRYCYNYSQLSTCVIYSPNKHCDCFFLFSGKWQDRKRSETSPAFFSIFFSKRLSFSAGLDLLKFFFCFSRIFWAATSRNKTSSRLAVSTAWAMPAALSLFFFCVGIKERRSGRLGAVRCERPNNFCLIAGR